MSNRVLMAVVATATLFVEQATAGLLPVNVTVTPDAGNYRWTYAIVLPTDSLIRSGDYFTIYDFGGLIDGTNAQPVNWNYSKSNLGPVPSGVNPVDQPSIPNLTWTYSGPTVPTGQLGLGNFWAISTYANATDSFFTARTHRTSDGLLDTNITETVVPVPTASPPPPGVPEPATLALAGLGVAFIGAFRCARAKR